ncbi:ABC transporter substrate-binding protein [Pseudomonas tohonis]|uniref:ABC transporter substrate-binding protein n=1 Tax=Pseudomonas tohonis TaxID=2725477 RepID=UPI001F2D8AE7|nr:ABC transporter substrate-binding protein [Pseudomonas tohonis]
MKTLINSVLGLFAPTLLAGVLGAAPLLAQAAEAPKEIRIAVPDLSAGSEHSGGGVVDVLRSRQILEQEFAKDGIEIQWRFFKGAGPVINEALANSQVDFAYLGDLAAIIGKASGLDTRLLSATARDVKSYLGVVPGSGIKTLEDLKGKRVAVFRGTANQLSFANALASRGLSERDYKVINLDFNAANAALAARQVDASWGLAGLIALREKGLAELPLSTRDLGGAGSTQAVLVGTGAFVREYPEITARLVKAQQQAVEWLRDDNHKQAYVELVSRLASYPPVILGTDLKDDSFHRIFDPRLDADFLARLQKGVDFAAEQRLIRKPFQVADWNEPRFLDAALKEPVQASR